MIKKININAGILCLIFVGIFGYYANALADTLWATSTSNSIYNTNSGVIGIGQSTPLYKLHVSGSTGSPNLSSAAGNLAIDAGGVTSQLTMGSYLASPYGFWLQTKDNGASGQGSGGSYPLILNPLGGHVGIGAINPSAPLEVYRATSFPAIKISNGNTGLWAYNLMEIGSVDGSGSGYLGIGGTAAANTGLQNSLTLLAESGASLSLGTQDTVRMRIDTSGKVGIGTITPTEALDVKGNIKLSGNLVSDGDICIGTCP
jgi:hypothetical protein